MSLAYLYSGDLRVERVTLPEPILGKPETNLSLESKEDSSIDSSSWLERAPNLWQFFKFSNLSSVFDKNS